MCQIKLICLSIFCFTYTSITVAQSLSVTDSSNNYFKLKTTIPGNYTYFNADMLDNIYLITAANRLYKLSSKGDSIAVFNDVKKYGNPSYLDVSNPLKILVYYKSFSTVIVLDRLLSLRNSINLRQYSIFNVQSVATAYDNNFWLFDEQNIKIKKINEQGIVMLESTDLRQLVQEVPTATNLIDSDNELYLYDENKGFYIFDYYGTFKNKLPLLHWKNVAISKKTLYGFSDDKMYTYLLNTLQLKEYKLP